MAATGPTTEAVLQAGLLPAQERRKECFVKVSSIVHIWPRILWCWIDFKALNEAVWKLFRRPEAFAKPNICRTRAGGCPVQSSTLFASHTSENNKYAIKSNIYLFCVNGCYRPDNWSCASGWAPACAGATERVFCKGLKHVHIWPRILGY